MASGATEHEHVPIDFALYMPKSWTEDVDRRDKAKVPADLVFKTNPELALELIARAIEDKIPGEIVLVDSAHGNSSEFRNTIRAHGLGFGVAVQASTRVWPPDKMGRRRGEPIGVQDLGIELGRRAFRRLTWRVGTHGILSSRFAFRRVKVAHDDGTEAKDREPLWLVIEWPEGEDKPTKFVLKTLPRRLKKKAIVRIIMERWRTERSCPPEDCGGPPGYADLWIPRKLSRTSRISRTICRQDISPIIGAPGHSRRGPEVSQVYLPQLLRRRRELRRTEDELCAPVGGRSTARGPIRTWSLARRAVELGRGRLQPPR